MSNGGKSMATCSESGSYRDPCEYFRPGTSGVDSEGGWRDNNPSAKESGGKEICKFRAWYGEWHGRARGRDDLHARGRDKLSKRS